MLIILTSNILHKLIKCIKIIHRAQIDRASKIKMTCRSPLSSRSVSPTVNYLKFDRHKSRSRSTGKTEWKTNRYRKGSCPLSSLKVIFVQRTMTQLLQRNIPLFLAIPTVQITGAIFWKTRGHADKRWTLSIFPCDYVLRTSAGCGIRREVLSKILNIKITYLQHANKVCIQWRKQYKWPFFFVKAYC